ncbi:hypothetical protein [Bacillus sp. JJ722]|uniref:hypothetical protein n=1 Tax=Bacillus sp. JJ722 TaxID=3122973 RepID=UPI002FFEA657
MRQLFLLLLTLLLLVGCSNISNATDKPKEKMLESLGLDRSKVSEFFGSESNDYTYTENSYNISLLFDEDTAFLKMKIEKAKANSNTEEETISEVKVEEPIIEEEFVDETEENESIDTSTFVYAESTDVTDALELK